MDFRFTRENKKMKVLNFLMDCSWIIYLFSQPVSQQILGEYPDAALGVELETCISLTPGLSWLMF